MVMEPIREEDLQDPNFLERVTDTWRPGTPTQPDTDEAPTHGGLVVGETPQLGQVIFPVKGKDASAIGSVLGAPRGEDRLHKGIDIFADEGTPVVASVEGTLEQVGTIDLGGLRVGIRDRDGNYHYYAHLSATASDLPPIGSLISAGSTIGYVGKTGNAINTPPHLHYSINEDGSKPLVDAEAFVKTATVVPISDSDKWQSEHQAGNPSGPEFTDYTTPLDDLTDDEALNLIAEEMPFMMGFMEVPELRDILIDAAKAGRSDDIEYIQSKLMQTQWWQERNVAQRNLFALKETDPQEYKRLVVSRAKQIRDEYIAVGMKPPYGDPFDDRFGERDTLYQQAETYLLTGMTVQEIGAAVRREAALSGVYDPNAPTPPGQIGENMSTIQQFMSNYMVNMDEKTRYELAQKVAAGELDTFALEDAIRDMARSKFAYDERIIARMDQGFTPYQLFSEHRNVVARTLGLDPEGIDFINDPTFARILNGGEGGASMSVQDAEYYIRGTPQGRKSRVVQKDGAEIALGLMQAFGLRG